jgi:hypothetical protein
MNEYDLGSRLDWHSCRLWSLLMSAHGLLENARGTTTKPMAANAKALTAIELVAGRRIG